MVEKALINIIAYYNFGDSVFISSYRRY